MGWADDHIRKLRAGHHVQFRPKGHSMEPKIMSGELVEVRPIRPVDACIGDIVLCRVKGKQYLHIVNARDGRRVQIKNNRGTINGWTEEIYGKLERVIR